MNINVLQKNKKYFKWLINQPWLNQKKIKSI